ncbi:PEP-CTERM sorting domain-containing protein [Aeoliella sp.]|uniref:PEP-CTERM sorting domain-containing protein n=1 Tax=Aeoliella sp. TaxID=2795800 RepID=UPI003CCBD98E
MKCSNRVCLAVVLSAMCFASVGNAAFIEVAEGTDDSLIGATSSFGSTPKANAVDGDLSTPYASNTSGTSFWRISLEGDHLIDEVIFWGRDHGTESVRNRTNNIVVQVRDVGNTVVWESDVLLPWDGVDPLDKIDPGFGPHVVDVPDGIVGENIVIRKIQADGDGMGLGEVQVWAMAVPEPSSVVLIGLGASVAVILSRRWR